MHANIGTVWKMWFFFLITKNFQFIMQNRNGERVTEQAIRFKIQCSQSEWTPKSPRMLNADGVPSDGRC